MEGYKRRLLAKAAVRQWPRDRPQVGRERSFSPRVNERQLSRVCTQLRSFRYRLKKSPSQIKRVQGLRPCPPEAPASPPLLTPTQVIRNS